MNIIEFVRLVLKHIRLLILAPLLLAVLVLILTLNPSYKYSSQTILYTGLATGSSIEMEKTFNYFATNIAFDNLINIINSRETQEEVGIRLLSLHLMLPEADPKYISKSLYEEFQKKIPEDIYKYVVKDNNTSYTDTLGNNSEASILFSKHINPKSYEKTVANLTALMKSSNDNFVYELLNYEDEHYSLKALSTIKAERINSSDLVKLSYTVNDPGICQQTLEIYNQVCIKNYRNIKENRSDAVVKYFEEQLSLANNKLTDAEDKLLEFNKSYNIINYYEQSKAVAVVKEDMEVDYNNKKAKLAGTIAAAKKIEEKLDIQKKIQTVTNTILDKKIKVGNLNYDIAVLEAQVASSSTNNNGLNQKLSQLKEQKKQLSQEIDEGVEAIYTFENSIEGVPITKSLPEWMDNVVETENLKATLGVMDQRNKDFKEQYSIYAPAGATIKRIEREISVSEQGYLEILHGLNLAKLKLQDNELSSNLKTIDPPYYPLSPIPTKRKILIIAAAFIGAILILGILFVMEYFDDTLKNSIKASKILKLPSLGMIPKLLLNPVNVDFKFVQNRLVELINQNINQYFSKNLSHKTPKTITIFSTQSKEGKTVIAGNIAKALKNDGKHVLYLNYALNQEPLKQTKKSPLINKIFGYQDPRIDNNNPFLAKVDSYLNASEYYGYTLDKHYYNANTYHDIVEKNNIDLKETPDYVIVELPPLIYYNYPSGLFSNTDLNILVCRSNRVWSKADQAIIDKLQELSTSKIHSIVNGVSINEIEAVLGELPKKRSQLRKRIKSMFRFQFFSKNQI